MERADAGLPPTSLLAKAELIVDAYNRIGVQAYTPGEKDLSLGVDTLKQLAGRAQFPFVAANLLGADGKPLFATSVVEEVGGLRIGVIGLVGQRTGYPGERLQSLGVSITDPAAAARSEAAALAQQGAQLLVVLSHLGPGEEQAVAQAVPEVRFIVGSHTGATLSRPRPLPAAGQAAPSTWALDAGSRGKHVGVLEIFPGEQRDVFVDVGQADDLQREIESQQGSLERFRKQLVLLDEDAARPDSADRIASRRASLEAAVKRMEARLAETRQRRQNVPRPGKGETLLRHELVPVKVTIGEDKEIAAKVAEIGRQAAPQTPAH